MIRTSHHGLVAVASEDVVGPLERMGQGLVEMLPRALTVLAVVIIGVLLSWLFRKAARWLVRRSGLETLGEKIGASKLLYAVGAKGSVAHFIGTLVWIAGLLITFAVVAEMLGLPGLAEAVGAITAFLPRLIAASFIVAVGLFIADIAKGLASRRAADTEGLESPRLVGKILYYTVVAVAVTMAVEQVGLETTLLNILIAVSTAAIFLSVGIAFALGARPIVHNILARHYLRSVARAGDWVGVGDVEGVVVRYTPTSIVVLSEGTEHVIPCGLCSGETFALRRIDTHKPRPDTDTDTEVSAE